MTNLLLPGFKSETPHNGTETSRAAAESIDLTKKEALQDKVYRVIKEAGDYGMTRQELQKYLQLSGDTIRPRVWELLRQGDICEDGTRKTDSGRASKILKDLHG